MKCSNRGLQSKVAKPLVYLELPNWLSGEIEVEDKSLKLWSKEIPVVKGVESKEGGAPYLRKCSHVGEKWKKNQKEEYV